MNNKVNWLIEEFSRDNSFLEVEKAALNQGHKVKVVESVPLFYDQHWNLFPQESPVVFLGSISCAKQIQREFDKHKWIPALWITWKNYLCSTYYAYWGKYLFNQDYTMLPWAEFNRTREAVFKQYEGIQVDAVFLRPNSGDKSFCGGRYDKKHLDNRAWEFDALSPEDLVLVSSIKPIEREWRVVCSNRKVVTGSRYKTHGMVDYFGELPDDVRSFSEEIINSTSWEPDPIYVLDICRAQGKLHLLEIGAFNVAGLYHCEFEKIVTVASDLASKEHSDYWSQLKEDGGWALYMKEKWQA